MKEILKVPGLILKQRLRDEDGVTGIILEPENYDSFLTATRILEGDSLVQILPSLLFEPELRQYQFNVHQFYSNLLSDFCKGNPGAPIPVVFPPGNPNTLMITFRSALVASLHEIIRFKSNNNPIQFNQIAEGTELGEMTIIYGGGGHQLAIGPLKYYR